MELMDGDLFDLIDKRLDEKEGRGLGFKLKESQLTLSNKLQKEFNICI
jgi:hypothetical protein